MSAAVVAGAVVVAGAGAGARGRSLAAAVAAAATIVTAAAAAAVAEELLYYLVAKGRELLPTSSALVLAIGAGSVKAGLARVVVAVIKGSAYRGDSTNSSEKARGEERGNERGEEGR